MKEHLLSLPGVKEAIECLDEEWAECRGIRAPLWERAKGALGGYVFWCHVGTPWGPSILDTLIKVRGKDWNVEDFEKVLLDLAAVVPIRFYGQ